MHWVLTIDTVDLVVGTLGALVVMTAVIVAVIKESHRTSSQRRKG